MTDLEFGIDYDYDLAFEQMKNQVIEDEELGYDSVWLMDHLIWQGEHDQFNAQGAVFECWTTLSALAAITRRIRLGQMVLCNSYRPPQLLAKMAATLDNISQGRLTVGIGAGWHEQEYVAYGYDFEKPAVRIAKLRESIIILKKMFIEDKPSYEGHYYRIKDAICEPKPVQKPHPPIWVGGSGENLTLRVVAELADGHNIVFKAPEECSRTIELLEKHCSIVGRHCNEIRKSWLGQAVVDTDENNLRRKIANLVPKNSSKDEFMKSQIVGTPDQCVKRIEEFADAGVQTFILLFRKYPEDRFLFAEKVIDHFK